MGISNLEWGISSLIVALTYLPFWTINANKMRTKLESVGVKLCKGLGELAVVRRQVVNGNRVRDHQSIALCGFVSNL